MITFSLFNDGRAEFGDARFDDPDALIFTAFYRTLDDDYQGVATLDRYAKPDATLFKVGDETWVEFIPSHGFECFGKPEPDPQRVFGTLREWAQVVLRSGN